MFDSWLLPERAAAVRLIKSYKNSVFSNFSPYNAEAVDPVQFSQLLIDSDRFTSPVNTASDFDEQLDRTAHCVQKAAQYNCHR